MIERICFYGLTLPIGVVSIVAFVRLSISQWKNYLKDRNKCDYPQFYHTSKYEWVPFATIAIVVIIAIISVVILFEHETTKL